MDVVFSILSIRGGQNGLIRITQPELDTNIRNWIGFIRVTKSVWVEDSVLQVEMVDFRSSILNPMKPEPDQLQCALESAI